MALVERFTAVHQRSDANLPPAQDVMTMGFHYMAEADLVAGTASGVTAAMRTALQARWDSFELSWKPYRAAWATLTEYVHANAFPSIPPPVPALLRTAKSSVGTAAAGAALPPQVAFNCTLETANRRHWGRFSLGALIAGTTMDNYGLFTTGLRTAISGGLGTLLNGLATDGISVVVITRPTWSDKQHTSVTRGLTIWPVTAYRIDLIPDVVRRRRWEHTTTAMRLGFALTEAANNPTVYGTSRNVATGTPS